MLSNIPQHPLLQQPLQRLALALRRGLSCWLVQNGHCVLLHSCWETPRQVFSAGSSVPNSSEAGRHGRDTKSHSYRGQCRGCKASSCSSPEHTDQALVFRTTAQTTSLVEQSL